MKVYASDEEQLKALSKWWKQNKKSTIAMAIALLIAIAVINLYKNNQKSMTQAAATTYYNIITSAANHDYNLAKSQVTTLQRDYSKSNYTALGSLIVAKLLIDEKAYDDAILQLKWVTEHMGSPLSDIAQIRIARIKLEQKKPELALSILNNITNKSHLAEKNLVAGDAYLQLKKISEAKKSYKAATQNADKSKVYELWELANMKYNSL